MLKKLFMVALAVPMLFTATHGQTITKELTTGTTLEANGDNEVDDSTFYAQGNDDDFAEYSLATFQFTAADFGGSVDSLTSMFVNLTVNDRTFAPNESGQDFDLFLTTDDLGDFSSLSFDVGTDNGFNASQFTTVFDLGTFAPDVNYATDAGQGGTLVPLELTLTSALETALLAEITSGSEFSIGIVANEVDDVILFNGFDDFFEPGGKPTVSITAIPEPSSAAVICVLGLAGLVRRRR